MTPITRLLPSIRRAPALRWGMPRWGSLIALTVACGVLAACGQLGVGLGGRPKPINAPSTASAPGGASQPGAASPSGREGQVASVPSADRPPLLPSLEALLGSIPRTEDGQILEPPTVPRARGLRVAVLLPLSGPNQRVGAAMLSAAEMALFDFAGPDFEMLVQDTKGTPEGAAEAARLAVGDGASMIVGPLLASSVRAVADIARAANVPVVAFSSDRTVVGDGVYTMGFFPSDEVRRVMEYAATKGARRFALLAPNGPYGDAVLSAMQDAAGALGGDVVQAEFYDPQASDFAPSVKHIANYDARRRTLEEQRAILQESGDEVSQLALKRLENLQTIGDPPFDALLVADGGKRLVEVAALLPYYDIDPKRVKILGTGQWDEQDLGAEPALIDGWYAAPDPAVRKAFSDHYVEAFGLRPHRLATLAYDAAALAVVLGKSDQQTASPFNHAVLAQPGGFAGRDGIFRFQSDGAAQRGLAVLQVGRRETKVVDPAPKAFPNY